MLESVTFSVFAMRPSRDIVPYRPYPVAGRR
jgi:hypothetical protein